MDRCLVDRSDSLHSCSPISLSQGANLIDCIYRPTNNSDQSNASLIIRHHVVTPTEPDDLLRQLLQICTYHMDVRPLSSGRSGAVSGEVKLATLLHGFVFDTLAFG
jgi:hypothetical protein